MAISPEQHKIAAATARSLMRMAYKPLAQSKKSGPTQPADPVESVELEESVDSTDSIELLKEEKPSKK